ncbi:Hsp20/alpha crystallin family protein [Flavobacterium myungsuense]|uniref:Hsp20/alpha crystallin family protein n=1 Tax=Flavobacterium myungsuense TaxID=651823 RepID=UPI003630E73D
MVRKKLKHTLPAVNIKETKKEFNIEFAAPGFMTKDFNIDLDDNVLTISAEKEREKTKRTIILQEKNSLIIHSQDHLHFRKRLMEKKLMPNTKTEFLN